MLINSDAGEFCKKKKKKCHFSFYLDQIVLMTTLFEAYKHFLCARTFASMLYVHVQFLSHLIIMLFFRCVDNKLSGALHA
jgi:hypothetical protein